MACVSVMTVVRVVDRQGDGSENDPFRMMVGYWDMKGRLIAEFDINDDPCSPLRQFCTDTQQSA